MGLYTGLWIFLDQRPSSNERFIPHLVMAYTPPYFEPLLYVSILRIFHIE